MQFITNPGVEARSKELLSALRRCGYSVFKDDSRIISSYLWVHGVEGIVIIRVSDHPRRFIRKLSWSRPTIFVDTWALRWNDVAVIRFVQSRITARRAA